MDPLVALLHTHRTQPPALTQGSCPTALLSLFPARKPERVSMSAFSALPGGLSQCLALLGHDSSPLCSMHRFGATSTEVGPQSPEEASVP